MHFGSVCSSEPMGSSVSFFFWLKPDREKRIIILKKKTEEPIGSELPNQTENRNRNEKGADRFTASNQIETENQNFRFGRFGFIWFGRMPAYSLHQKRSVLWNTSKT